LAITSQVGTQLGADMATTNNMDTGLAINFWAIPSSVEIEGRLVDLVRHTGIA